VRLQAKAAKTHEALERALEKALEELEEVLEEVLEDVLKRGPAGERIGWCNLVLRSRAVRAVPRRRRRERTSRCGTPARGEASYAG